MDQIYIMGGTIMIGLTVIMAIILVPPLLLEEDYSRALMMLMPLLIGVVLGSFIFSLGLEDDDIDNDIPRSEPWREEQ